ncbi:MAG: hypothetical protein ACFFCS_05740 [Candidatus Hodarchaeota archaeon]
MTAKTEGLMKSFKEKFKQEMLKSKPVDLPEVTEEEIVNFKKENLNFWDTVGYSRPLSGWMYEFMYALLGAVLVSIMYPFLLGFLYTWPEIKAYVNTSGVLFSVIFFALNVPTNYAIERWVADYRVKNPKEMVQYMSFYCWYQMMTGLVLITSTSLYVFWIVRSGMLAYTSWLLLVLITREYPAMLNIFLQSLKGMQQLHWESKVNFAKSLWEPGFEITFVIIGKYVWGQDPVIGPLLGAAIGYSIGVYIDDFFTSLLSAWYLNRALKPMGLRVRDVIRPNFTKMIAKKSFWFGFKLSIPGMVGVVLGFFTFFVWYDFVPAYATYLVLNGLADELANLSKRSEGINTKGAFAEALNNGKFKLAQYYIQMTFKYYGLFTVGLGCIVIAYYPIIIKVMLVIGGAENYILAIPFIIPNIIATLFEQPAGEADKILLMGDRSMFKSFTSILQTFLGLFFTWLYIAVFKVWQYGFAAMVYIIPLGGFIPMLIRLILNWWYVNKYICKIKIALWQSFVAPIIPGIIQLVVGWLWAQYVFPPIENSIGGEIGGIVAAAITVVFAMLFGLVFSFLILYGFFGGWDDHSLRVFKEAVYNSGPSRLLFIPVFKIAVAFLKISPFHNRFPVEYKEAEREMVELMIQREKISAAAKKGEI